MKIDGAAQQGVQQCRSKSVHAFVATEGLTA